MLADQLAVVRTGTGIYTYTAVYGTFPTNLGPGTYTFWAYIDANENLVFDPADVSSAPVTKTWAVPAATTITPTPTVTYSATNLVTPGSGTHTITVVVKDQWGFVISGVPVTAVVSGANAGALVTFVPTATNTLSLIHI